MDDGSPSDPEQSIQEPSLQVQIDVAPPWYRAPGAAVLLVVLLSVAPLVAFEQLLERNHLAAVRETALQAADSAQEAVLIRLRAKGPISARRDVVLAGDEIVDPGALEAELEGVHGWRVHVGTTAAACPAEEAEQTVLVNREIYRGLSRSRGDRQILRCDPLEDRFGEVVGVIAVAAPASMFVHGLVELRLLAAAGLGVVYGAMVLLGFLLFQRVREAHTLASTLAEQQNNMEAAADLLRREQEALETDLKRITAERDDALATETSRSAFLLSLAGELRDRMARLIHHAEHVLSEQTSSEAPLESDASRREIHQILDWAQALRVSIDDLRDAILLETGQLALSPETFEIRGVIEELALEAARALSLGGNTLTIEMPGDPPGSALRTMHADRGRLRQVLANLLSNAAKYTRDGAIRLSLTQTEENIRFEVQDDGIGMDPVQQARIFDAFVRFDPAEHTGLGLGLTVARGLVEKMGGSIEVQSTLGAGSVFTVTLPCPPSAVESSETGSP